MKRLDYTSTIRKPDQSGTNFSSVAWITRTCSITKVTICQSAVLLKLRPVTSQAFSEAEGIIFHIR